MPRRHRRRGDRGAILVIVAVFAVVAVLMLAAVVDLGNLRQEKKQVTLATDASALAAAASIDFRSPTAKGNGVDCSSIKSTDAVDTTVGAVASRYWRENGGSGPLQCTAFFASTQAGTAYVTVAARESVDLTFAGATGQPSGAVTGSSSARIASASGGLLYPVGLCTAGAVQSLQGALTKVYEPPVSTSILFDGACGGAGNKRQVQFNVGLRGDSCGSVGMWCWDFNHGGFDVAGNAPAIVESDTGKDWQKAEATIAALAAAHTRFWIPAIQARPDLPQSGTFAKYQVTHFVEVEIQSYSKRKGFSFLVYQVVPYTTSGPPATSNTYTARVHLCGTGEGVAACDVKTAPPPNYVTPPPVLDFRDLCKVVTITPATQTVNVDAADKLTAPVTVSYTVVDPVNCDPPVSLRAVSSLRTVTATPGARAGNTYPFTFATGTVMGPDATDFVLEFSEDTLLADNAGRLSTLGPCRVKAVTISPTTLIGASGNALQEKVTVRLDLSRAQTCTNLTVRVAEHKSNPVTNTIYTGSPATATFDIVLNPGAKTYPNNSTWDVSVLQNGTALTYTPTASFHT